MADDSRGFDWLYGKKGNAPEPTGQASPDDATQVVRKGPQGTDSGDESTRVIPTMSAGSSRASGSGGSRGGGSTRRTDPSMPRPSQIAPTPGSSSTRRRRRFLGPLGIVGLLIVVLVVSLIWTGLSAWHSVDKVAFEPKGHRPDDQGGTNYLVVASDSRAGLTKHERHKLKVGNAAGQRTDTIKILHTGSGPNVLTTIPRDSEVDVPGHGTTKINAAFAWGGPKLLTKTIEQDTGLHIDQYVEIGMGGLVNLVDSVGGVQICPTQNMKDKLAGLNVKKGCQDADGLTALAYSRSRHVAATGDLARGVHQDEVIAQLGKKIGGAGTILNPFKIHSIGDAVGNGAIKVGKGMSLFTAAKFALAFKGLGGKGSLKCGVPISDMSVHWDPARSKTYFHDLIENDSDKITKKLCTPTGLPKSVTG